MSYTVTFYEVDLETIKKTLGSRDLSILDKTKFDEEDKEGLECARVLLTGGEQNPELGSQFGYAFEKVTVHGQNMKIGIIRNKLATGQRYHGDNG